MWVWSGSEINSGKSPFNGLEQQHSYFHCSLSEATQQLEQPQDLNQSLRINDSNKLIINMKWNVHQNSKQVFCVAGGAAQGGDL